MVGRLGFDPTQFTTAPLQTEGWIRFADPPDRVFAQIARHEGLTEWLPLLKKVTVTHPRALPPGESMVGTTRALEFPGGITLVEHVVFWDPPRCYAYDTQARGLPLHNYIGFVGVEPAEGGGGTFVFQEYFDVHGSIPKTVIPYGILPPMRQAFDRLSPLIGGTEFDVQHVKERS